LFERIFAQNEVNEVASVFGTLGKVVGEQTFGYQPGVAATAVCLLINDRRGRGRVRTCSYWGVAVASSVNTILNFIDMVKNNAHFEGPKTVDRLLSSNATLVEKLASGLAYQNVEYGGIESLPVAAISVRSDAAPTLREHVLVKDMKIGDLTFNSIHADSSNGNGHIFITPAGPAPTPASLQKRHDGPGLKITYTTRVHSGLDDSKRAQLAGRIGDDWGFQADGNNMGEYIGLVKLAEHHQAVVYFRIIPEERGYGENYENVDVCGGQERFL
jgi:hypothetical protein